MRVPFERKLWRDSSKLYTRSGSHVDSIRECDIAYSNYKFRGKVAGIPFAVYWNGFGKVNDNSQSDLDLFIEIDDESYLAEALRVDKMDIDDTLKKLVRENLDRIIKAEDSIEAAYIGMKILLEG